VIDKKMTESEQATVNIPESVSVLLDPISEDSATGTDAANEEEYFRLDMEIGKVSPDYDVCIQLAKYILKERSKDLRVAAWLCFAWYRSEKISGLKNGLILILELLKNYSDMLFPSNPVYRQKAINFLNSSRFVRLLENENVDANNSSLFIEIEPLFQNFVQESKNQFPDVEMEFKEIMRVLESHINESKNIIKTPPQEEVIAEEKKKEAPSPEKKDQVDPHQRERISDEVVNAMPPLGVSAKAEDDDVISEKSAVFSVKKILRSLHKREEDLKKNEPFIFGMSRALVWGRLVLPPEENKRTQIAAPDASIKNTLNEWFVNGKWNKLISAVELNFLDEDSSFKYWLDAQKFVIVALERLGGDSADAADEVKFQLSALLRRYPRLSGLLFNDDSPFADGDTRKWIEEEIQTLFGDTKGSDDVLPPILGEDYESINEEYRAACKELPENFEINVDKMQQEIERDTKRKGRFLRILNLANFCIQAKEYVLAKVHLTTLLEKIDSYQLTQWEPALSVAVWESTYVVNSKLLQIEKDSEHVSFLEKQQRELFSKIGSYDGVLALKLANRTKRKGD
jgi:type VI secretion system protein VasJ